MRAKAIAAGTSLLLATSAFLAEARPIYARRENQPCGYCHVSASGGGERGFRGQFYGANGLTFNRFLEKREAGVAGLAPNAIGRNSIPTKSYNGNVSGPAPQQIQLASLRGPVLIIFLDKAEDQQKAVAKQLALIAKGVGTRAMVAVVSGDGDALDLTDKLGGELRVYADAARATAKKFKAEREFDMVLIAKMGSPIATLGGYSKAGLTQILSELKEKGGVDAGNLDLSGAPDKVVRGELFDIR
ncbi:MAG TPA: hypothetical protein VJ835_01440 [Fimbriimonadaceae bacterium]|nr:hypothetical protein [Fimbriimonadaceae bacterium]